MLIDQYGPFQALGYKLNQVSTLLLRMIEELEETEDKVNVKLKYIQIQMNKNRGSEET
jgi:hypothetical protein